MNQIMHSRGDSACIFYSYQGNSPTYRQQRINEVLVTNLLLKSSNAVKSKDNALKIQHSPSLSLPRAAEHTTTDKTTLMLPSGLAWVTFRSSTSVVCMSAGLEIGLGWMISKLIITPINTWSPGVPTLVTSYNRPFS